MTEPADDVERWLPAARAGSPEALGQALEACRGYLLLIAAQELDPILRAKVGASDLIQETFLKAHRHFNRFEGGTEAELRAWLRRLLLNNLADVRASYQEAAKRQATREVPLQPADSSADPYGTLAAAVPSPSTAAMAHEQVEAVRQVLERLPENYRRVIVLRYQHERSFGEIGQELGLTENAARKLLLRAVERVQQEMGGSA